MASPVSRHRTISIDEYFFLELHKLISTPNIEKKLQGATLQILKKCCNLLAWQLEFTNPRTGILQMDRLEEMILLGNLKLSLKEDLPPPDPQK